MCLLSGSAEVKCTQYPTPYKILLKISIKYLPFLPPYDVFFFFFLLFNKGEGNALCLGHTCRKTQVLTDSEDSIQEGTNSDSCNRQTGTMANKEQSRELNSNLG